MKYEAFYSCWQEEELILVLCEQLPVVFSWSQVVSLHVYVDQFLAEDSLGTLSDL